MCKHLQNLERFFKKLQFRYGDKDELVIALKNELESVKDRKSANPAWAHQNRAYQEPAEAAPHH